MLASFFIGEIQSGPVSNFMPFLFYTILTAIVANVICYSLYAFLLKFYTVTFLTFASFISPFITAILGLVFLNEKIPFMLFVCSPFIGLGLFIFYREEVRLGYLKKL